MKNLVVLWTVLLSACGGHPLAEWNDLPETADVPRAAGSPASGRDSDDRYEYDVSHDAGLRGPVDLEALVRFADEHNPRIGEARAALGMAASRRWQAELYSNPSVEFETEETGHTEAGGTRGIGTVALVQPISVGRSRGAVIEAATAEQRAMLADLEAVRLEVLGDLRMRYVELLFVRRELALNQDLAEIVNEVVRIARIRFEARASPETELIKAQIESARLELNRTALDQARDAALARIASLLGGVELAADQINDELPPDLRYEDMEGLRLRLVDGHPRLAAGRHRIDAARRRVEEARGRALDEVGVRVGYARDYANDDNLVTAGISVPLPLFDRGQASVLGARYGVIEELQRLQETRGHLVEALTIAWQERESANRQLEKQRLQIVKPAERAWTQMQAGYQAGNVSFLDLLDAQRTLVDARSMELAFLRNVHLAEAQLWKLIGPVKDPQSNEKFTPDKDSQ